MILPLARNVRPGAGSVHNAVPAQRFQLPAVANAAIRDLFNSSAHLTKPERWYLPEGSI